jgi:hypothetical protein
MIAAVGKAGKGDRIVIKGVKLEAVQATRCCYELTQKAGEDLCFVPAQGTATGVITVDLRPLGPTALTLVLHDDVTICADCITLGFIASGGAMIRIEAAESETRSIADSYKVIPA